jgi:multidrug efflux pump subunit AcrA (membrane-fusion protein)
MDTLAVLVSIPEASASLLRVGQPMEVKLLADHIPNRESNLLRIDFIPPAAPQLSGAYAVGLLDNSKGKLQPGMSGIAILSIGKKTLFSGLRARFNI